MKTDMYSRTRICELVIGETCLVYQWIMGNRGVNKSTLIIRNSAKITTAPLGFMISTRKAPRGTWSESKIKDKRKRNESTGEDIDLCSINTTEN